MKDYGCFGRDRHARLARIMARHVAAGGEIHELYDAADDEMVAYLEWSFFEFWGQFTDAGGGHAWRIFTLCRASSAATA